MTTRALLMTTLALLSGCWVSQSNFEDALCLLDEDGDGDPRCGPSGTLSDGDCDDSNGLMSTIRDETGEVDAEGTVIGGAYDGYDNDCTDGDLLDVDGDGYPGISRAAYEALPDAPPWPSGLREEVDCHDLPIEGQEAGFEVGVHPNAAEVYYDSVDGNCDGLDDYDQDQDGFASKFYADVYTGGLPATDCDDNRDDINPDSREVANYDGDDGDCDGANDFDPDGDGRLTPGYGADAVTYRTQYGYDDLTWIADADCLDLDDSFGGIGPEVNQDRAGATFVRVPGDGACDAGVAEGDSCESTWYDGLDDSCDEMDERGKIARNDFDQDGDGYVPSGLRDEFIDYVLRYAAFTNSRGDQPYLEAMADAYGNGTTVTESNAGAWYDAHENDCNDTDPSISPDGLEILGDSADQDCDGGDDTARFAFDSFVFTSPGPVRAVATDDYLALLVNASGGVDLDDGAGTRSAATMVFSWENTETLRTNLTIDKSPFTVIRSTDALHAPVSVVADGPNFYSAVTWSSTRTRLSAALSVPTEGVHFDTQKTVAPTSRTTVVEYTHGDLRCDSADSTCWQVACDGSSLHWFNFEQTTAMAEVGTGVLESITAEDCYLLPGSLSGGNTQVYAVDGTGASTPYEVVGGVLVPTANDPLGGLNANFIRSHGDWLIAGQASSVRLVRTSTDQFTGLTGTGWVDADAAVTTRDGRDWWAIVGAKSDGSVELAYGSPTSLTRIPLPIEADPGTVSATSVAVAINGDRLLVGVGGTAGSDQIGWTLFELP